MNKNDAGTLDISFDKDGRVFPAGTADTFGLANAVVAAKDGDLYLSGRLGNEYSIIGLKKDGSINTHFNAGNMIKDHFKQGFISEAKGIGLTSNYGILISGLYHETARIRHHAFALYDPKGNLNTDFGVQGKAIIPATQGKKIPDQSPVIVPLADGGILVASSQVQFDYDVGVLYRLHKNGTVDMEFGNGAGYVDIRFREYPTSIAALQLQPDGKIIFGGACRIDGAFRAYIARYHSNYTIDLDFGENGFFINPEPSKFDQILSLNLNIDGTILATGSALQEQRTEGLLLRLTDSGRLDPKFNHGRVLLTTLDTTISDLEIKAVSVQRDNKIVVMGDSLGHEEADIILARFLPDGVLDPTFGAGKTHGGWVRTKLGPSVDTGRGMVLQADDRAVIVGAYSIDDTAEGLRQVALRFLS